jgi:hypothetical protein
VSIQAHSRAHPIAALKDIETGRAFTVVNEGNVLRFVADDVPAMGYRTYVPVEEIREDRQTDLFLDESAGVLENEFVKCTIDVKTGAVVSLREKQSGREMVNARSDFGFGQYLYERFSKADTEAYTDAYVKGGWEWSLDELGRPNLTDGAYQMAKAVGAKTTFISNAASVGAIIQCGPLGGMPHDVTLVITLYRNMPYVEFIWSINSKPAEPWPEAGWISFPFNMERPAFRLGRLGAVVDPATDFVKGSNFDYCFLNTGMAVIDEAGRGFGLCSPDTPGISLDRPGLWRYSGSYVAQRPNVFVNLFNNQWSTNFTEWIEGSWSARMYVWAIDKCDNGESIVIPSEELRVPLAAVLAEGPAGTLPAVNSGLSLSRRGVFVTAFGKNPDGNGTLLRLWEQTGNGGICTITLPPTAGFTSAQACTLRGERIAGKIIPIAAGSFAVDLQPYQPLSLLLEN